MKTNCVNCNKEIDRRPSIIKKRKHCYCSTKCQMNYEYKNGLRDKFETTKKANEVVREKGIEKFKTNPTMSVSIRGYLMIYVPGRGQVKFHHYVWEQKNGKVPKGYQLHHKDGDRFNNKIENLQLLTSSEHGRLHYEQNRDAIRKNKGQFIKKE